MSFLQISSQCANTASFRNQDITCSIENVVFTRGSIVVTYTIVINFPDQLASQVSHDVRQYRGDLHHRNHLPG